MTKLKWIRISYKPCRLAWMHSNAMKSLIGAFIFAAIVAAAKAILLEVPGYATVVGDTRTSYHTNRLYYRFRGLYYAQAPRSEERFLVTTLLSIIKTLVLSVCARSSRGWWSHWPRDLDRLKNEIDLFDRRESRSKYLFLKYGISDIHCHKTDVCAACRKNVQLKWSTLSGALWPSFCNVVVQKVLTSSNHCSTSVRSI